MSYEKVTGLPNIQKGISKPGGRGFSGVSFSPPKIFLEGPGWPWLFPGPGDPFWVLALVCGLLVPPGGSWASVCWRNLLTGGPSIPADVPDTAISLVLQLALSHPGHRMRHSETSRQLRRDAVGH